ncbi:MAG: triose-phosphate isomerase [Burkholderiaceae bacterium]
MAPKRSSTVSRSALSPGEQAALSRASASAGPLVLGNWKMHGSIDMAEMLLADVAAGAASSAPVGVGVCPPYPYLGLAAARLSGSPVGWGAQDLSAHSQGAYTGEVSAAMLKDLGCTWVLVGHSERRTLHGETDAIVAAKLDRALEAGLVPVVCFGESLSERESSATESVIARQIDAVLPALARAGLTSQPVVLAYEPVWAIGTGLTASPDQAQQVHAFVRARIARAGVAHAPTLPILYGGSVKPGNAAELFAQPDVDGGLIGGASLVAKDFLAIAQAARQRC